MPAGAATPTLDGRPVRILLVEDSATDQELVRRALREPAPLPGPVDLDEVRRLIAARCEVLRGLVA